MALPKQHLPRRRRQILDDQTRDQRGFGTREYRDTGMHEDGWVKYFSARLTGLVRKIRGSN